MATNLIKKAVLIIYIFLAGCTFQLGNKDLPLYWREVVRSKGTYINKVITIKGSIIEIDKDFLTVQGNISYKIVDDMGDKIEIQSPDKEVPTLNDRYIITGRVMSDPRHGPGLFILEQHRIIDDEDNQYLIYIIWILAVVLFISFFYFLFLIVKRKIDRSKKQ